MLVDKHTHRIVKEDGIWKMYCPQRGPDDLIYTYAWRLVEYALRNAGRCPHDQLLGPAVGMR